MMKLSQGTSCQLLLSFSKIARLRFERRLLDKSQVCISTNIDGNFADRASGFCKLVDRTTLLNDIMTTVEDLVSDTSQHVRAALGTQISGLAPILGKQEYALIMQNFKAHFTKL
jgi:hypothetical protein